MSSEFGYNYRFKPPVIAQSAERITKTCRACGAEFVTGSRVKFRCDPCQDKVTAERHRKHDKNRKRNAFFK